MIRTTLGTHRVMDTFGWMDAKTFLELDYNTDVVAGRNTRPYGLMHFSDPVHEKISQNTLTGIRLGMVLYNLSKVAGYIPIVGTVIGIARLVFSTIFNLNSSSNPDESDKRKSRLISPFVKGEHIRGTLELFSIGILNAPIDLYWTIFRPRSKL